MRRWIDTKEQEKSLTAAREVKRQFGERLQLKKIDQPVDLDLTKNVQKL